MKIYPVNLQKCTVYIYMCSFLESALSSVVLDYIKAGWN